MVEYRCKRCGYFSKKKFDILSHLKRKIPCKVIYENINPDKLINEIELARKFKEKKYPCKYCNEKFSDRSNRSKHEKTCIQDKFKKYDEKLEELSQENERYRLMITSDKNTDIVQQNTNNINYGNIVNGNVINNNNNINNNINVSLTPYEQVVKPTYPKDMQDPATKDKLMEYIKEDPDMAILEYHKQKYFNNNRKHDQCIKMTEDDLARDIIKLWSKDNKWNESSYSGKFMNENIYFCHEYFSKLIYELVNKNPDMAKNLGKIMNYIHSLAHYGEPEAFNNIKDRLADIIVEMSKDELVKK
jgi:hypothetical protein